uniref:Glucose-6-phosphate isomerase n=1 Tax=Eimeria tenella TaxID=5802 RepID=H9B978_EIMTE|nr:hypothetical protein [Eimeria tenella]
MSSQFAACKALKELQHQKERNCNLRELIKDDERNQRMYREFGGACMDFSRQLLDKNGLDALMKLAEERQVEAKVKAMFQGDKINSTEQRRVLHVALRAPKENKILLEGNNIIEEVHSVLRRIKDFSNKIRSGELRGATGAVLKNLICVGIGGSYLGTEFVVESLRVLKKEESKGRQIRFLANVDPTDVARSVEGLSPEETLVLIISKTFTTAETILNARSLKHWLLQGIGREDQIGLHLCAVSTNLELTAKFGIQDDRVFGFWDWVGGRFSVTSAVGVLPLAIHYGYDVVEEFLKGCHAMDQHFLTAPVSENLPMLMGLCSVFNSSVLGTQLRRSAALLPGDAQICCPHSAAHDGEQRQRRGPWGQQIGI